MGGWLCCFGICWLGLLVLMFVLFVLFFLGWVRFAMGGIGYFLVF